MKRQITLLGSLNVTENGRPSAIMNSAKGSALLAYLLVSDQTQSRDVVADLLWEATSTRQARQRLRELLGRMRKWLPELQITRQTVAFQADENNFVDLFVLRADLHSTDWTQVDAALQLYTGDLLVSFHLRGTPRFNEWLVIERERLRLRVFDVYRRLLDVYFSQQQWDMGIAAARRWLALDDLNEEACRLLMRLLAANGQAAAALQQYATCRQRLQAELGVAPDIATQTLAQQIKNDTAVTPAAFVNRQQLDPPPADFLPDPGALPPNTYLPYHRNPDFIGRQVMLRQLAQQLLPGAQKEKADAVGLVTAVTGMGGIGKTQLAVEFAYRYGRYFPGGVFWLSFATADNVAEEVAALGTERYLGLYQAVEQLTLADQVGRVQRAWQEPLSRLLIFDNCETEALLAEWLPVTGGCRVLLTSRRASWARELGVSNVVLHTLTPPESATYLQRAAPHVTAVEAAEIAYEVGYLPLALHLAGGYLQRYRQISPTIYLNQLRDKGLLQHPSLKGRGSTISPTGHDLDVGRTFAINIQQLNLTQAEDEMVWQLLARAACFAPGEPLPQKLLLETVATETMDLTTLLLVEDGLNRLAALGFLKVEAGETAVMHRLLVAFIIEISAQSSLIYPPLAEAQTAVETRITQTLADHRHKQGHLSTLPFSAVHLRHVAAAALARKAPLATNLAALLGRHLINIGNFVEAETVLKQAILAADEMGDIKAQAQVLSALASTQESLGHDQDSLQSAQQAAELLRRSNVTDAAQLAEALYRQGWAHFRLGQAEAALHAAQEGYAVSEAAKIRDQQARCLSLMGVVNYYLLGNYAVAATQMQASLALFQALGYQNGQLSVLNNMGESARLQGDYVLAATYYGKALTIAREIKNRNKEILILSNLCGVQVKLGDFGTAVTELEDLVNQTPTDWFGLSEAYRFLAEAYLGQGKTEAALATAQQALALAQRHNPPEIGRAWRVLGLIAAQMSQPLAANIAANSQFAAADCFRQSINFFDELNLERDRAITLWHWACYELAHGDDMQGNTLWQAARETFKRLNLPLFVVRMDSG